MKSGILLLGGVLIVSAAWGADSIGDDTVGHWYVAPQLGDTITDGSRHVDDRLFYGLAIGKHLNEDWSAEINVLSGKYDGHYYYPDLRLTPISIDALRVFDRGAMFSPYVTGGIGTILDNLRLSQARADAVRDHLVAHGVQADQLTTRGCGKAQPIADNRTAEGRAQNRRVVMRVLDNPSDLEIRRSDDR